MCIFNDISLGKINDKSALVLVEMLNTDNLLQDALGSEKSKISTKEFIQYNNEWCKSTNSELLAIILNNIPIGTISLSHQNKEEQEAQIGYWIGSKYWRKGYTSIAFYKILDYAKSKKIKLITAEIKEDNLASKRIWEKNGAETELTGNRFLVSILLKY